METPQVKLKKCRECPNEFRPYRSTDRYCSPACARKGAATKRYAAHAKPRTANPRLHRKPAEPAERTAAKLECKQRVNYVCQLVGVVPHVCGIRRHAHHIIYLSEHECNEQWNLICLCDAVHVPVVHADKGRWQPALFELVFGGSWYRTITDMREDKSDELTRILLWLVNKSELNGKIG